MIKKEWLWINDLNKNEMENNKLIAEFMGYEVKHGKCYSPKYNDGTIAPMQFNRSWDWIMPAVESCLERLDARDTSADQIIKQLATCHIDYVYQAVVEFIQEYNDGCHQTYNDERQ